MTDSELINAFNHIVDSIISVIDIEDVEGKIDYDYNNDILTIYNEAGTFVLNKQSSVKEIWLSSPISGPHHFIYDNNKWISRQNVELLPMLNKELKLEIFS